MYFVLLGTVSQCCDATSILDGIITVVTAMVDYIVGYRSHKLSWNIWFVWFLSSYIQCTEKVECHNENGRNHVRENSRRIRNFDKKWNEKIVGEWVVVEGPIKRRLCLLPSITCVMTPGSRPQTLHSGQNRLPTDKIKNIFFYLFLRNSHNNDVKMWQVMPRKKRGDHSTLRTWWRNFWEVLFKWFSVIFAVQSPSFGAQRENLYVNHLPTVESVGWGGGRMVASPPHTATGSHTAQPLSPEQPTQRARVQSEHLKPEAPAAPPVICFGKSRRKITVLRTGGMLHSSVFDTAQSRCSVFTVLLFSW